MARFTQDREDLLLEATALVPRVMLRTIILGELCEAFAGFRCEALSIYFGPSPVYHFNSAGELRRAYIADLLVKAEEGRLVGTVRHRTAREVVLSSTPLSPEKAEQLAAELTVRLSELRGNLERGQFELVGQSPHQGNGVNRLQTWLADWPGFKIATIANVN
jgi:hypothetical protein